MGREVAWSAVIGGVLAFGVVSAQVPEAGIPPGGAVAYETSRLGEGRVQVDLDNGTGTVLGITPAIGFSARFFAEPTSVDDLVAATAAFIDAHPALFGASSGNLDLRGQPMWRGKAWVVNGTQFFAARQVVEGSFQLAIARDGRLLFLRARLFPETELGAINLTPALTADAASDVVLRAEPGSDLVSDPKQVIAFRRGQPVIAWMIEAADARGLPWLYLVAGDNGEILAKTELFHAVDVEGDVQARGTHPDSLLPDVNYNPPTANPFPLPELLVDITAGAQGSDETNDNGDFLIPGIPDTQITVRARATSTPFDISPTAGRGDPVVDNETGAASSFFTLRLNPDPTEFTTSQINAFVWMEKSRDYADLQYLSWSLNVPVRGVDVEVNRTYNCNAFYATAATSTMRGFIHFGSAGNDCPNMAYSTVVAHEFGHHFTREVQIAEEDLSFSGGSAKKEATADVLLRI